jgi:hypothetical protein
MARRGFRLGTLAAELPRQDRKPGSAGDQPRVPREPGGMETRLKITKGICEEKVTFPVLLCS